VSPLKNGSIERMLSVAGFDFDHPQIGIARHGARNIGVRFSLLNEGTGQRRQPGQATIEIAGLIEETATLFELVDLQQYHPARGIATTDDGSWNSGGEASAQVRPEPELGRQSVIIGRNELCSLSLRDAQSLARLVSSRQHWRVRGQAPGSLPLG